MNIVCDLDGVVYRAEVPIPGSREALEKAANAGFGIWFATNNSTRTPEEVQAKLRDVSGLSVEVDSIVTSAQAAASMLETADAPALVLGSSAIVRALTAEGIEVTTDASRARSVVVGLDRDLDYDRLTRACNAIRNGARFVATNIDPTLPVEGGLLPGSGAMVAAVSRSTGVDPEIAGKPHPPIRALLERRGVGRAWAVGDRVDTDVALAAAQEGWKSILVMSGVTRPGDDVTAADAVVSDLAGAIEVILAESERG